MANIINKTTPIILTALATGIYTSPVQAQTNELMKQVEAYGKEVQGNSMGQVTNVTTRVEHAEINSAFPLVNQLRDVSPTDWSYEALRSLVDRYGCIAGFPNQTYRGDQPLSRYEFAAGLNSCLNQIERLIASQESVGQGDIEKINRLSEEFEAELAATGGRVDEVESRTALLEDGQFSTTTKLAGEVIFAGATVFTGTNEDIGEETGDDDIDEVPVFGYRTRLELETSFIGEDLLFTRLSTGNFSEFSEATGTFQGELSFSEPSEGDITLEVIYYDFPIGDSTNILIGAAGLAADDIANTVNVLDGDGGGGAITAFGTRSPIYLPPGEAGLGIIQRFGEKLEFSAGYLAGEASDPSDEAGLFDGNYTALGQLLFTPVEQLNIAFTYSHTISQSDTATGSDLANIRSLSTLGEDANPLDGDVFEGDIETVADAYNLQFSWAISDRIVIGGWGGYQTVSTLSAFAIDGDVVGQGTQDIFNWAATLAFPDLGKEGSTGGIIVGMEPWVAISTIQADNFDEDETASFHAEIFYEYRLNDNIAITPGVIYISNPDNNEANDDLVIGTIRTTFNF